MPTHRRVRGLPGGRRYVETAVEEQQLPWISVSDLRGRSSVALGLYNVQRLPANFLIDKEGTIVAKNIYGKSLEAKLDELTK